MPVPSRFTATAICVSWVLRAIDPVRMAAAISGLAAESITGLTRALLTPARAKAIDSFMTDAPDSMIPYDEIVQEALRAVVGRVLGQVESAGGFLPAPVSG